MSDTSAVRVVGASVQTDLPIIIAELGPLADRLRLAREAIDELRVSHPQPPASNVKASYMSPWKSHLLNDKLQPASIPIIFEQCVNTRPPVDTSSISSGSNRPTTHSGRSTCQTTAGAST